MDNDCKGSVTVKVFSACENLKTSINGSVVRALDYVRHHEGIPAVNFLISALDRVT